MAQRDPFSWASDYADTQSTRASQESSDAQQTLMNVFAQEAARQRPYSDLPVDLAKQNNQYALQHSNQMAVQGQINARQARARAAPQKIASSIRGAASRYGVDTSIALTIADIESGFRADAQNSKTSAGGVYQFIDSTWEQYGGGANKLDPDANIDAGVRFIRDNAAGLRKAGLPVNAGTIYLAHQQGLTGAIKLLSNPNAPAEAILGREKVRLNSGRHYRPGMTAQAFANMWMSKAEQVHKGHMERKNRGDDKVDLATALNALPTFSSSDGNQYAIDDSTPPVNEDDLLVQ